MTARIFILSLLMIAAVAPFASGGVAEELNDQAVALEGSGSYAHAAGLYQMAAQFSPDKTIRVNLWRARVRTFLHAFGPRAQQLMILMTGFWIAKSLLAALGRMRASWRRYALYRRIRVANVSTSIINRQNEIEPDNTAYPDARALRVALTVKNAGVKDHPLCFAANLIGPDDTCVHTLRQFIDNSMPPPLTRIDFDFDNLPELVNDTGGAWRVEIVLENNLKHLARQPLRVITREMMLDDLLLEDVRLLVFDGEQHVVSSVVPTTAQSIIPTVRISPMNLRAEKFTDLALRFELIRTEDHHVERSQDVPLRFNATGVAEFCELSHPVAQHAIAEAPDDWQFKLFIAGRWLASIDFVVRRPDDIIHSVRVDRFDVAQASYAGNLSLISTTAFRAEAATLMPVAHLSTPYPSPLVLHDVMFGVMAGDEVLGQVQDRVALNDGVNILTGGELDLSECDARGPITFFLLVNGQCVGAREVELKQTRTRHADIEGRLTAAALKSRASRSEADEILNSAHVVV